MKHLLLTACLLGTNVSAQSAMTGPEFDAYTQGKTLFFAADGQQYGVEEYLPDNRVRWSFMDGQCKEGLWYEQANQICFVYEDSVRPQCWSFYLSPGGISAVFEDNSDGRVLYEVQASSEEMICLGPEVGV
ncbi:hypothetical protein [Shimia sp.]|uniref:hypothetical protein n=1 Tax=Shimia sp. TaxID=1954381 RepID=UPI003298F033